MVAGAVFAVGILGIVKLQGQLMQSSSDSNARALATQLAQEVLDDLNRVGTSTVTFAGIANNSGGSIAADTSNSNGQTVAGNVDFQRTWVVTSQYYSDITPADGKIDPTPYTAAQLTAAGKTIPTSPDVKSVDVTVTWLDQSERGSTTTEQVTLSGMISSITPQTAAALSGGTSGSGVGSAASPKVSYSASSVASVVAVHVGDVSGTYRETLTPTVDAGNQRTTFKSYTYGSDNTLKREEEFETVACTCTFSGTGSGYLPAYSTWDSYESTYKDVFIDSAVTKPIGSNAAHGGSDDFCDACCKDHHDAGSSAVDSSNVKYCDPANGVVDRCYDPFRGGDYDASGRHKHYSTAGVAVTSGNYIESCRFKRVDGYWRVYQDWHMVKFTSFPLSLLDNSSNEALYEDYIRDVIDQHLSEGKVSGETLSSPPSAPSLLSESSTVEVYVDDSDIVQKTARGVFLDHINSTHLTQVLAEKSTSQDYFIDVPFYEFDVTQLSTWSSGDTTKVIVGAGDGSTSLGHGAHAVTIPGGGLYGVATTAGSTVSISAAIRKSNSALAALSTPDGIDFDAAALNPDNLHFSATEAACVDPGCSSTTTTSSSTSSSTTTSSTTTSSSTTSSSTSTSTTTTTSTTASRTVTVTLALDSSYMDANDYSDMTVTATYSSTVVSCSQPAKSGSSVLSSCTLPVGSSGTVDFRGPKKTSGLCSLTPSGVFGSGAAVTLTINSSTCL